VAGRVAADEVEWQAGRALLSCGRGVGHPRVVAGIGADPRVVQQRGDLVVGADDIAAVGLARHRGVAQLGVEGVGVGSAGGVEDLVVNAGLCHDNASLAHAGSAVPGCLEDQGARYTSSARRSLGSWPVTLTVAWSRIS